MRSDLQVASNLMLEDEEHHPHYRHMPGDLLAEVYREFVSPPENMHFWLTQMQRREYLQYLPCLLCGRACAGACSNDISHSTRSVR
jgi:hypothetical protein